MSTGDNVLVTEILEGVVGPQNIQTITRMGGLTNRTYKVETDDKSYMVRLPGEGTEEIIKRADEKVSTELACKVGIDAELYFFDDMTGVKVSEYIENSETLSPERMREEENIKRAAAIFKILHTSGEDTKVPFDVIDMAETYENFILKNGGFMYDDYADVKAYIDDVKTNYLKNVTFVPCHNDALCENWILQGDRMYLIDWEYAGMNDPMWDLADVSLEAEYAEEMDAIFLDAYFGRTATAEEWKAFQINKVLIDYLWSLWGKTRAVYDGEELEQYAKDRWTRLKVSMKKLEEM